MTHRDNITAILESYFTGFREDIIELACIRILEQEARDQEPKTGHWTKDFICSLCGCKCYPFDIDFGDYNYCPNCGVRMIGIEGRAKDETNN